MKYQEVQEISKQAAEEIFSSSQPEAICNALLSVSFHETDWKWAQNKCLYFLQSANPSVSETAATCLGHIARVHRKLEQEKVVQSLLARRNDVRLSGIIDDALDDINMFLS